MVLEDEVREGELADDEVDAEEREELLLVLVLLCCAC